MLTQQIQNLEAALAEDREESGRQAALLRERYESALREVGRCSLWRHATPCADPAVLQVQDSMELQTTSTGEQLTHLHEQLSEERAKFAKAMAERAAEGPGAEAPAGPGGESAANELARLKKMLGAADSEVCLHFRCIT